MCYRSATAEHELRPKIFEIRKDDEIGATSRRNDAPIVEPEIVGRVRRRHSNRVTRVDSSGYGATDHEIDVSLVEEISGLTVIGAKADPVMILGSDQR